MKHTLIKLLTVLLALCMMLSACGSPAGKNRGTTETTAVPTMSMEERVLGRWQTAIDCSQLCTDQILQLMGQELAVYFDFSGVSVDGVLILLDDGTFTMTIDEAAAEAFSEQITQIMRDSLRSYLEQALAEELAGFTLDSYLAATGLTIEDLMVVAGVNMGQLILDMIEPLRAVPCSGTYYLQDTQLHIAGTVCNFLLTEDSLSIYAPEESADLAAFPALFPLEFVR